MVSFWMHAGRRCCNATIHPTKDSSNEAEEVEEGRRSKRLLLYSPGLLGEDFPTRNAWEGLNGVDRLN